MGKGHPKLRGLIREKFSTQAAFAETLGMHSATLSNKLSGKTDWTRQEIERAAEVLDIAISDIPTYFFT